MKGSRLISTVTIVFIILSMSLIGVGCNNAAPPSKPGHQSVTIPDAVQEPAPAFNESPASAVTPGPIVEIGYDTGTSSGTLAMRSTGYSVKYAPDCKTFIVKGVKIYGKLYGSDYDGKYAELRIVDQNFNQLYSSTFEYTSFSTEANWVRIEIADVVVSGLFHVFVQTDSPGTGGISIGYDSSFSNQGSDIIHTWKLADWSAYLKDRPKESYNWMVRVTGTSADINVPVTSPLVRTAIDWDSMDFEETVKLLDTPEKLSHSMLNNMTSESHYLQWKETGITYRASPTEIFETRVGCCAEFSIFACYVLEFHNYEAEILTISVQSDPSKGHAVCVYHLGGLLYTIDMGRIKGPFELYKDIAYAHHKDWSGYRIYYSWEKYQAVAEPDDIVGRTN